MKTRIILTLALIFCLTNVNAQQTKIVSGKVSILNDLPVSGVTVKAKKSMAATRTDSLGNFIIACNPKDRLVFESRTFRKAIYKVSPSTQDLNVKLSFVPTEHNINMAVGYGYIRKDDLGAATQQDMNKNYYSRYDNVYDVIRAKFTGVQIINQNCVVVRGIGTITGKACAQFVVNGTPETDVDYIQPSSIKEISLLKDGTAAIYGAQSGNGVFIITLYNGSNEVTIY